tara:strand:- start:111 stop:440 length:330 start_codon:yes stop_codon:yes gene_type:complete
MGTTEHRRKQGLRAYQLREKYGYKWSVIARMMASNWSTVRTSARKHAQENDLEWPLESYSIGRMIYDMLCDGWTMAEICTEIKVEPHNARKYAWGYAQRRSKPWPGVNQ